MTVTVEQVLAELAPIEPIYEKAAKLGPEAIPHLEKLAAGSDVFLAANAVYLASLIGGDRAVRLLLSVANSPTPEIRIQAAAGARNLPKEEATNILLKALDDSDFGVRNVALKSAKAISLTTASIQKKIETLSRSDPEQFIREFSN